MRAVIYYISTTVIAVILGVILVKSIKPGYKNLKRDEAKSIRSFRIYSIDTFLDLLRNMFPENLLKACIQQEKTVYFNVTMKGEI
jgi:Na+/H+-dicarboxylate symporter